MIYIIKILISLLPFFLISCGPKQLKNYEEFRDYAKPDSKLIRIPVIIVPGVKGSILKRGKKEYWGKSYRVALYHTFDELQFPIDIQFNETFIKSFGKFYAEKGVRDGGIMEKYMIALPFVDLFDVSIYNDIRNVLEKSGGYSLNKDLFMFSYDWRLDNRISASHLAHKVKMYQELFLENAKNNIFAKNEDEFNNFLKKLKDKKLLTRSGRIKVNIIAHSMGGIVSQYYIQALGGEDSVNKLIMLGTPNQGAMDALKAISEGEFPESILHFYRKISTRPIIFSWPSTFQLLPRYSKCITDETNKENVININDWGLGNSYRAIKESDIVIKNWITHNLVPPIDSFEGVSNQKDLNKYLSEQLTSAAKFYSAINGDADEEYETDKLYDIKSFADVASISVDIEIKFIGKHSTTPFILFGGHCEPTLKYAYVKKTKNNFKYLDFDNPIKDKEKNKSYTMGDGRVPIVSLRLPLRENICDFQFLLCEDHTSMVSSKTFQFNLLRELLWQSNCLY